MFDRILVPLDGSTQSEAAIPFVEQFPSKRVLLLFVEPPETRESDSLRLSPHAAAVYLERHARTFRQRGREAESTVEFGDPAERIVELAAEANLIVMATHSRGSGGRLFFGDYAERVARHAPVPTMLVRGGITANGFGRVLTPLDGSPTAEEALPIARRIASAISAPIQLVRIAALSDHGIDQPEVELYFKAVIPRLDRGMPIRWEVGHGDPACELIARTQPRDLVVMATHGEGGLRRWCVGNVAEQMVRRAPAPVLLVRDGLPAFRELPPSLAAGWWQSPSAGSGNGEYVGKPTPAG
jgi:nucleotide-binding universal stress UspA family protein